MSVIRKCPVNVLARSCRFVGNSCTVPLRSHPRGSRSSAILGIFLPSIPPFRCRSEVLDPWESSQLKNKTSKRRDLWWILWAYDVLGIARLSRLLDMIRTMWVRTGDEIAVFECFWFDGIAFACTEVQVQGLTWSDFDVSKLRVRICTLTLRRLCRLALTILYEKVPGGVRRGMARRYLQQWRVR